MAPRRVAAALATDDDTLADSIRQDVLGASGTDDQQDDGADDQGADDQGADDQPDDGADDQGADDQPDDGADDQGADDQPDAPAPRRRAAARQEPNAGQLSPEAETRIATAERIAADAVARSDAMMAQFGQSRETPEQEAARLALMTPEQLIDYKVGKALGQHSQTVRQVTFNAQNTADKASFDAMVLANPQLKRYAADAERKHNELVREGARTGANVPTRQQVLIYQLGERALELAQKAAPQQRERTQRVQRQQARPGSARSDVSSTRRRETTLEQRLENVAL